MIRLRSLTAGLAITGAVAATCLGFVAVATPATANDPSATQAEHSWPQKPQQYDTMPMRGLNMAGADYNYEFELPTVEDGAFYAAGGMNTIRLPFKWEYLQSRSDNPKDRSNNPAEPIDWSAPNASRYGALVDAYVARGMHVILDMHNYMRYDHDKHVIGSGSHGSPTADHLAAAWKQIASRFANNPLVSFDLMNEPHSMPTELIVSNYNLAIAAVRQVADNRLMLEGNGWSGAHSWTQNWYGTPNSEMFTPSKIHDPKNNWIVNVHQYFDPHYIGVNPCTPNVTPDISGLKNYLKQYNFKAIVTEIGGQNSNECAENIQRFIADQMMSDPNFIGYTAWAGGTPARKMWHLYFGPLDNGNHTVTWTNGFARHLTRPSS